VRPLSSSSARQLPETDGATFPFWSPDNKFIGFFVTGKLKKVSVSGAPPIVICDAPNGRGGTWNQDGVILFSPSFDLVSIHRVSASGGVPTPVTHLDSSRNETNHRWPHFLPDGKHFIYTTQGSIRTPDYAGAMYVASLDGSMDKLLIKMSSNMAYYNGYLLYVRQRSVVAQPFDLSTLELSGDASPVAEKIEFSGDKSRGIFSISNNGVLTYQTSGNNARVLSMVDRSGRKLDDIGDRQIAYGARLSRDGTKVVLDSNDPESNVPDIWIYDMTRKINSRFTFDQSGEWQPICSPDGKSIVYCSDKQGSGDIYMKNANGTEAEQLLFKDPTPKQVTDWSPDGRYVLYQSFAPVSYWDLWVFPIEGDRKPFVFLQSKFEEVNARFSPDGRWVTYQSDESGKQEIYVRPFPSGEGKWQISSSGGESPLWSRDGKEIYYNQAGGTTMVVDVNGAGAAFVVGSAKQLFNIPVSVAYDVTADGKQFLMGVVSGAQATPPVTLVTNWDKELKKK
jgi:Tol biopolymer transport system component